MSNTRAWSRYVQDLGSKGKPDPGLSRFNSRFNLASSFEGVTLTGVSDRTAQDYSSGIRVALAYSALEALNSALGQRVGRARVDRESLANKYRSKTCTSLREMLDASIQSSKLRERLIALEEDPETVDVMPVASGVRHLVFHGDFTAHGSGAAQSAGVRLFLDELADALIERADEQFELYLDREGIGPWSTRRRATCPSCGVTVGRRHGHDCDIALCKTHGERRTECFGDGRHGATTYWGVYPGTIEALKRGWTHERAGREEPDINRVIVELDWDAASEQYV